MRCIIIQKITIYLDFDGVFNALNTSLVYRGVSIKTIKNGKIKFRSTIVVNRVNIHIGFFDCRLAAAYAYDEYVTKNNLEHTKNFD